MTALAAGALEAGFAPEPRGWCATRRATRAWSCSRSAKASRATRGPGARSGVPLLHPWANRLAGWDYEALGRRVDLRAARAAAWSRPTARPVCPMHGVLPATVGECRGYADARARGRALDPGRRRGLSRGVPVSAPDPARGRARARQPADRHHRWRPLDGEVPVAFGFHPYFTPPAASRGQTTRSSCRRCAGSRWSEARCRPARRRRPTASAGVLGDRHLDDGFDRLPDGAALRRSRAAGAAFVVRFEAGYSCAQVFAPLGKDLICFEPMTAPANALRTGAFAVAAPWWPYAAAFSIAVDAE